MERNFLSNFEEHISGAILGNLTNGLHHNSGMSRRSQTLAGFAN